MSPPADVRGVALRFGAVLGAWAGAWLGVRTLAPHLEGAAATVTWTALKAAVWFGLSAWLLQVPVGREWLGVWRPATARWAVALALGWAALDTAALRLGLEAAPAPLVVDWGLLNALALAPSLEELACRGLLWRAFERAGASRGAQLGWTTAAFVLLHVPGWVAQEHLSSALAGRAASVALVGLLCCVARLVTGSVWAAALVHWVNNAASVGLFAGLVTLG